MSANNINASLQGEDDKFVMVMGVAKDATDYEFQLVSESQLIESLVGCAGVVVSVNDAQWSIHYAWPCAWLERRINDCRISMKVPEGFDQSACDKFAKINPHDPECIDYRFMTTEEWKDTFEKLEGRKND